MSLLVWFSLAHEIGEMTPALGGGGGGEEEGGRVELRQKS